MRNAVFQNKLSLDIIIAPRGDTCDIIQTECYVFILDESANALPLLNHVKTQVNVLSSLLSSLRDLIHQWFIHIMGLSVKKIKNLF